jgi:hypothetical protein
MAKKAWVALYKDRGDEDDYVVWLDEEQAYRSVGSAAADLAQANASELDWEEGVPESLTNAIEAAKAGRFRDAYGEWREFASDYGPVERDVELFDAPIGE